MSEYRFKLGISLPELQLPFEESLATAKELGAQYLWVNRIEDRPPIGEMSDEEVDQLGESVAAHGLEIFLLAAASPFKHIHLTQLKLDALDEHEGFRADFGGHQTFDASSQTAERARDQCECVRLAGRIPWGRQSHLADALADPGWNHRRE